MIFDGESVTGPIYSWL